MAAQLVALPTIERLSPVCIRILGGNPGKFTLQGTNTYLLGSGKKRILLDTGEGRPAWAASLKSVLQQESADIDLVLLSHWHGDHVGGVNDLLSMAKGAKIYKNDPSSGQESIHDGQVFRAEGVTLTAAHTPGHTSDHMVFHMKEEDALFTADNVLGQGTAVFENLRQYLQSLARMKTMFKGCAYPGHGPVLADGPGKIAEYIEHRQQREDQVMQTMRAQADAAWQPMDIVKVIYTDVPVELHPAACHGVVQILNKLEEERHVQKLSGDTWQLMNKATL